MLKRTRSRTVVRLLVVALAALLAAYAFAPSTSQVLAQKQPAAKKPPKAPAKKKEAPPPFEIVPDAPADDAPAVETPAEEKPEGKKPTDKKPAKKPAKAAGGKKPAKGQFVPLPEDPALPDGMCPACLGMSHVPLTGRQPYVHVEGDRPPRVDMCVPWQPCPQCSADASVEDLVEAEKSRLANAGASHTEWEKRMGMALVRVETRHVTLHCQMAADVARKQGEAAEQAIAYIQKTTRGVLLSQTRPPSFEMVYLWDKGTYEKAIGICKEVEDFAGADDWHLFPKLACFNGRVSCVANANQGQSVPPEHLVISQTANRNMLAASGGKSKHWLTVGFAYHVEYAVKNKVLMHYVRYQLNEAQLQPDWAAEARKMAGEKKLIHWSEMLDSDLVAWTPPHHISAFTMVSFLMRTDPVKFAKMTLLIRDGAAAQEAMEKMYGMPLDKIEAACGKWVLQGAG